MELKLKKEDEEKIEEKKDFSYLSCGGLYLIR